MNQKNEQPLEIKILQNQQAIIELSKLTNNILLYPFTIGGGNIEHYYHFIFDLILPLSLVLKKTSSNVVFSINDFGIFTSIAIKIFKNRINILNGHNDTFQGEKINLIGMNPDIININCFPYRVLKKSILLELNITNCRNPYKILLIERLQPDPYFINDAKIKGSGASRRSIQNHNEVKEIIESRIKPPYEFQNIQLEKMSIEDQIRSFNSAIVVIAQHGAGLSNILWMRDKSVIIEFGFKSKTHFKKICLVKKNHYFLHNYNMNHINIDCIEFAKWLSQNPVTAKYFLTKHNI